MKQTKKLGRALLSVLMMLGLCLRFLPLPAQAQAQAQTFSPTGSLGNTGPQVSAKRYTLRAVNSAPIIANNNTLSLVSGTRATITTALLNVTDADAGDTITYIVTTLPSKGTLKLNNTALRSKGIFTQADIDANNLTFTAGSTLGLDSFDFSADDGHGNSVAGTFNIRVTEKPLLTVTTTGDSVDDFDGDTSLREAIIYANSLSSNDVITFSVTGTIRLSSTLPAVLDAATSGNLTISNTQTGGVTISGDANNSGTNDSGDVRLFLMNSGANLTLNKLTLSGGRSEGESGSAVLNEGGTLRVTSSTLQGNFTTNGGTLYNGASSKLKVTNSTLTGNTASYGGAIESNGTLRVINSTLTGNSATTGLAQGGALYVGNGTVTINNSIVAGNTAPTDSDIHGIFSGTHNIIGGTATEAGLDPAGLKDNGGPTPTIALVAGSPAINAGNSTLKTDQRGIARPQGNAPDIGAFEVDNLLSVSLAPGFSSSFSEAAGAGATTVRITRTGSTRSALTIALRSSDTTEATIPGTATIVVGDSFVDVPVDAVDDMITDGTQSVLIKATATGYVPEKVDLSVIDDEAPPSNLSLRLLPSAFSESKTGTAATLVIQHDRTSLATAVNVNLSSTDARLNVPNNVQIPAGKRSVEVAIMVTADSIMTGTKTSTLNARATNFTPANTTATIYDAQARITLSLAPGQSSTIKEGATNNQTTLRVTRNTPSTGALVVTLSLNKGAGQVSYPPSVTIADGAAYADFIVSSVDDSAVDGTQSVVVLATATGYGTSTAQLYVQDNDAASFSAFKAPDEPSQ